MDRASAFSILRFSRFGILKPRNRRFFSAKPDGLSPETSQRARSRIFKITSKFPRFLQRYTTPLIDAPLTHITSFLLLHELTAIVPLFALAATFHYTNWLPPYVSEGKWVEESIRKFGNYFRKKGWLGEERTTRRHIWWGRGEQGVRVVTEFATAYVITKALLPFRLMISISATPWFAKTTLMPLTNLTKNLWKTRKR